MSGAINRKNFKPNETKYNNRTYNSYEDFKVAVYSKTLYDSLEKSYEELKNVLKMIKSNDFEENCARITKELKEIYNSILEALRKTRENKGTLFKDIMKNNDDLDTTDKELHDNKSKGNQYLNFLCDGFASLSLIETANQGTPDKHNEVKKQTQQTPKE